MRKSFLWAPAVLLIAACGTSKYAPPPDVDSGTVAGVVAEMSEDSLQVQEALVAVGAVLSELFADENVRVALGQSINNNIPTSTCVTSASLGFGTFVNFGNCAGGGGQVMFFTTPFGINMFQFGDETTPLSYHGVTFTGTLALSPVDGVPLTYTLTPDLAGEATPLTVGSGGNTVDITMDFTASLRMTGPNLLVWGEGTTGAPDVSVYMGEPGTVDATGNPPSWEAPPTTCSCPLAGQTGVDTQLTIKELILDLDLLLDGDGIGNDDFGEFNMDIEDIQFDDSQLVLEFAETCGTFEASAGATDDLELVVSKADIIAAIESSDAMDKAEQRDAARARLQDEITLKIKKDTLAAGAQNAFGSGFDSSICTM